jgi:predicted dehydrogenase
LNKLSRRQFGKSALSAAATTAALGAAQSALSADRVAGANNKVRLGFIGLGNRGDQVMDAFLLQPDCEIVAVCDLWQPYLDFATSKAGSSPKQTKDYRRILDNKDVDAVVISTPDHWHALQTIQACQAGKDIYVEKPLSLCVAEGRRMVDAARAAKVVTQVGLHRRSAKFVKEAAEIVRSGEIGKITSVRAFHIQNEFPKGIGNPPDGQPPEGLDWDAWLGPAPVVAYNKNRTFYRFRWFFDYSGGQLTNFGVHYLDVIHLALGQQAPLAVTAMGGKVADMDNRQTPDTLEVLWTYAGGTLVSFSQYNASAAPAGAKNGQIEFRGTKGTMYVQANGYELVPEALPAGEFPVFNPVDRKEGMADWKNRQPVIAGKKGSGDADTRHHARNFLDCVRSRETCNCDIETGHRNTSAALIGNISLRTESFLKWDEAKERFTNSDEANKLLNYEYRAPYKLT